MVFKNTGKSTAVTDCKAVVNKYAAEVVARHITNVTITSDEDALYIDDTAINNAAALDKAIKQLSDKVA